jgi:pimeloyl-ACP methyl ester carboxylesterase
MDDPHLASPLEPFHGEPPEAPQWFSNALRQAPKRMFVTVADAKIETLIWEPAEAPTKPGLLLVHGSGAHADWWSFIAPYLAQGRRVVAFSFSGMGRSDWRPRYTRELFASEVMEVAAATGLFDGGAPIVVGHSFGGRVAIVLAATEGEKFRAAVIVDPPVFAPDRQRPARSAAHEFKPHRVYPTFAAAMARFRFAPMQPCANLFIADHIARLGLHEAPGGGGWTWRFDPFLWKDMQREDPTPFLRGVRCPVALIRGGVSKLMRREDALYMMGLLPEGSPYLEIPEADHHVMVDQPLAFAAGLDGLIAGWPR